MLSEVTLAATWAASSADPAMLNPKKLMKTSLSWSRLAAHEDAVVRRSDETAAFVRPGSIRGRALQQRDDSQQPVHPCDDEPFIVFRRNAQGNHGASVPNNIHAPAAP